jgi:hypothetical protein
MAHALCMQDWTVVGGNASTVLQDECDWVDLLGYQDAAIYLDVASVTDMSVQPTIMIQTSPARDEVIFGANILVRYPFSVGSTLGIQPIEVVRFSDSAPLARYVRWSVNFLLAGPCAITFRIWLSLKQAGW